MGIEIRDERAAGRYTAYLDGQDIGHVTWTRVGTTVLLPHTEVGPEHGGQGIGSLLARRAFDDARAEGLKVVPLCSFMKRWADLHPGYADVVRRLLPGEFSSLTSALAAAKTTDALHRPADHRADHGAA